MSVQETWAGNIIIQAVADAMNFKIYIIESDKNFRDLTIVEPANTVENPQSIYIRHIGQVQHHAVKIQMKLTRTILVHRY